MKQKRKAKSLFSSKIWLNGIGIISLLGILWWVLCLASIWLQNRSVIAAEWDISTMKLDYDWVNDEVEVVYGVSFLKEWENNVVLSNIYKEGSTVYLSPNSVAVNPQIEWWKPDPAWNKVEQGVYGHVLWWEWNKLSSANVTIIAWNSNIVEVWNANATVLWWKQNVLKAGNQDRTAILVWWFENHILNSNKWVSIIWWENNYVQWSASNVTILWGKWNVVEWSNAIVWWSNVGVPDDVTNIFAFSDKTAGLQISAEQWKWSDSFYLNVENGVWINTEPTTNWVETSWAVEFGDIDVTNTCGDDNYGVQWTWNGCLVWCTLESGKDGGKWELLDSSENCEEKLCGDPKDPNIVCPGPVNCEIHPESEECKCKIHPELEECKSRCVGSLVVDNERMNICVDRYGNNLDITKYYRTDFEKVLIDSDEPCPDQDWWKEELKSLKDNQCVYKCKSDYHLIDNKIEWENLPTGSIWCYHDCKLPWDEAQKIKHGAAVTWYSNNEVYCAYTADTPASEDTCANYKATLVCVDGTLFVADAAGKPTVKNTKYNFENCTLWWFSCNTSDYNLKQSTITAGWKYPEKWVSNWKVWDRNTAYWTRWEYKACIDFKPTANTNEDCDENGSDPYHYQLTKCKNWYSTGADFPYECRGVCYAGSEEYLDWQTKVGYVSSSVTCPLPVPNPNAKCEAVTYTCVDGHWKDSAGNENTSPIRSCSTVSTDPCSGYTIPWTRVSELINVWYLDQWDYYKDCTSNVKTYDWKWCSENQKYKFDCSSAGYSSHSISLLGGYGMNVCVQDPVCGDTHYNCSAWTAGDESSYVITGTLADGWVKEGTWYDWTCSSKYGFVSVDCHDEDRWDPVAWVCGDAKDGCSKWNFSDLTDSDTEYKWECKWINGGKSSGTCTSPKPYCGDGIKNNGEECDYNDSSKSGWWANWCSTSCKPVVNPDEYQCIWGFAWASVYGQSDQSLDKNYVSVLLDSQIAQQQVAAWAKCVYVCNSPFWPVDTNEDWKYDNCQNPTPPPIHKCTDIPDNAKEIKGIWNSKKDVESTLYENEASVPSDAKCAYVCDDNYHKDWNECKENSYKCTDIPDNANQVNGIWDSKKNVKSTLYADKASAWTTICAYICKSWYHKDWTSCEANVCKLPAPSWNGVVTWTGSVEKDQTAWSYTGSTSGSDLTQSALKPCEWTCKKWYSKKSSWNGCEVIPGTYQCKNIPANAIEVNGIWDSKKDVESTLIAYNDTSLNPCVYKCDHKNWRYYYDGDKKCHDITDWCDTSTPYGCENPSKPVNTSDDGTKYTWDCELDGVYVNGNQKCEKRYGNNVDICGCDSANKLDWNGNKFDWQEGKIYYWKTKEQTIDVSFLWLNKVGDTYQITNITKRGDGTSRVLASLLKETWTYYFSLCGKWYTFQVSSQMAGTYGNGVGPGTYFVGGNCINPSTFKEAWISCKAKENWKCDYSKGGCSAWTKSKDTYQWPSWSPDQKMWTCEGIWGWTSDTCIIKWDKQGKCSPANNGHCGGMFTNYASFSSGQCLSASAYEGTIQYQYANAHTEAWPCAMHEAIPYTSACSTYDRNYVYDYYAYSNVVSVSSSFYRCFDWKETIKCKVHVSGSWEEKADSYCSWLTKPSDGTSLASETVYDHWTDDFASTKHCQAGSNAKSCSKVYEWTTPITNSFVGSGTDTSGVSSYCSTMKSETACLGVKVINFKPNVNADLYVAPGWIVNDTWKTNNKWKRSELTCCKWSS